MFDLLQSLGIYYRKSGTTYITRTYCHGGNSHGLNIYIDPNGKYRWKCWTRGCEKDYGSSLVGLIKCIKNISTEQAKEFLENHDIPDSMPRPIREFKKKYYAKLIDIWNRFKYLLHIFFKGVSLRLS